MASVFAVGAGAAVAAFLVRFPQDAADCRVLTRSDRAELVSSHGDALAVASEPWARPSTRVDLSPR